MIISKPSGSYDMEFHLTSADFDQMYDAFSAHPIRTRRKCMFALLEFFEMSGVTDHPSFNDLANSTDHKVSFSVQVAKDEMIIHYGNDTWRVIRNSNL